MNTVEINGVKYVKESTSGEIKIVVLDNGFVYVGHYREEETGASLRGARNIIRWGTTEHLGELVDGPLENTKLGRACNISFRFEKLNHTIEVNQDAWKKY
jgi:hypothetical protein